MPRQIDPAASPLERLLTLAVGPVGLPVPLADCEAALADWGARGRELAQLLARKNGFYAFESALLIRPIEDSDPVLGIASWNAPQGWRAAYPDLPPMLFVAEDLFGNPFAIHADRIVAFDAETGEREPLADDLEGWIERVLADAPFWTGWPLGHEWQEKHGALPLGKRLAPRRPFVLGGEYAVDNLVAAPDVNGMVARGKLARQLAELPPGSPVDYELRV